LRYSVKHQIGQGGFGIVNFATGEDGNGYAIKNLNLAAYADAEVDGLKKRFEREVRYQAQINHPNVVKIIEHNLDDDPPWFVMPLAEGSLKDDLEQDRTLGGAPQRALFDILAGLEALHEKGFCHRDLKPANVLKFQEVDGSITYRISDFGLTTPGVGQTTTLTGSNMAGGTPLYRAPECANNFRRATAQADIYSFGAILHDVFGGGVNRVPHSRLTVPGPVGPIVQRCTEANSRRRFRSVAALREVLFDVLNNEEVEFYSQEEEDVIKVLRDHDVLEDSQWDRVFNLIDDNADRGISNYNIMRALSRQHIIQLFDVSPDMAQGLGEIYSDFAQSFAFDFEYCDIISDKAQIFYDKGDLQLKAQIAIAMLNLGASHNRWRVERQFMQMAGHEIDDVLANRIRIELEVRRIPFNARIAHIEVSIAESRNNLHPVLLALLDDQ
jgi:serine/threonine protein kinase